MLSLSCLEPQQNPGSADTLGGGIFEWGGAKEGTRGKLKRDRVWRAEGGGAETVVARPAHLHISSPQQDGSFSGRLEGRGEEVTFPNSPLAKFSFHPPPPFN